MIVWKNMDTLEAYQELYPFLTKDSDTKDT